MQYAKNNPVYLELRKQFTSKKFRDRLKEELGAKCRFCECMGVEYHHLIPLSGGGTNDLNNIIPVCPLHHKMIHSARNIHSNAKAGGRKSPITDKHIKAYEMYINGEIGNKKLCELVSNQNPDKPYRPMETAVFKKWIKTKGILRVRNILDVAMTNSDVKEGREIGEIEFIDGSKKPILFHDTGMNSVEYKERGA